MTERPLPSPAPALPVQTPSAPVPGAIVSRSEFQAAVVALILQAVSSRARHMWWVSPDCEHWPFEDAALLQALTGWARSGGVHLTWLAHDFEALRRSSPRCVRWRQTWAHVMTCAAPDQTAAADMPTLLLVEGLGMLQMFDTVHWRGRWSLSRPDLGVVKLQIDALSQRLLPMFPVTTLGI